MEVKIMAKTMADFLIEQGRQIGLKQARQAAIERGIEEGTLHAKQDVVVKLLTHYFPDVSDTFVDKVREIKELSRLETLFDQLITATSFIKQGTLHVKQDIVAKLLTHYFPDTSDIFVDELREIKELSQLDTLLDQILTATSFVEKGIEQGTFRARQDDIIKLLTHQFPDVSDTFVNEVREIKELSQLDTLLDQLLTATSFDDIDWNGIGIQ